MANAENGFRRVTTIREFWLGPAQGKLYRPERGRWSPPTTRLRIDLEATVTGGEAEGGASVSVAVWRP